MFELADTENTSGVDIRIVGVGGGGGNTVNYMVEQAVSGVSFVYANTDRQALISSPVSSKIHLGADGMGAGADPNKGRAAAESEVENIRKALEGADMVFVTAGMGGGTGTGAAPVVAQVASDMGILTVGVVTKPFFFERRDKVAEQGVAELSRHVDSLITIPNDKIEKVLGGDFDMFQAFDHVNDVLKDAVIGVTDLVTRPGIMNVDFNDLKAVMSERGVAMMGMGSASGEDRALRAAEMAVSNPLLEDVEVQNARGVLVNVSASRITNDEFKAVGEIIENITSEGARVIIGMAKDDSLGEALHVTVVATGLDSFEPQVDQPVKPVLEAIKTPQPAVETAPVAVPEKMDAVEDLVNPAARGTGTHGSAVDPRKFYEENYKYFDTPAVLRKQQD